MSRCAKHCGDVGQFEPYRPCGKPAVYEVNRATFAGGPPWWMACEEHAREAKANGSRVDDLDDAANDTVDEPLDLEDRLDAALAEGDREDDRLAFEIKRAERVERFYEKARDALCLAYRYQSEERNLLVGKSVTTSDRIRDCLAQVKRYREAIRSARAMQFSDVGVVLAVALSADAAG